MTDIKISVRMFGAFRKYGEQISFTVRSGSDIAAIKEKMAGFFGEDDRRLVSDSVLADDAAVLAENVSIKQDTRLAILPPVCGG